MLYPNRYRFFVFYGSIEEATINLTSGEGTITMSGRKLLISGRHFPLVFSFFAHLLPAEQTPGFAQNPMQRNIETSTSWYLYQAFPVDLIGRAWTPGKR